MWKLGNTGAIIARKIIKQRSKDDIL